MRSIKKNNIKIAWLDKIIPFEFSEPSIISKNGISIKILSDISTSLEFIKSATSPSAEQTLTPSFKLVTFANVLQITPAFLDETNFGIPFAPFDSRKTS